MTAPIVSISPEHVKSDFSAGLVTVTCPRCGITAGIFPGSDAWHVPCRGARMVPVDPTSAARLLWRARKRRYYRSRTLSKRTQKGPGNRLYTALYAGSEGLDGS